MSDALGATSAECGMAALGACSLEITQLEAAIIRERAWPEPQGLEHQRGRTGDQKDDAEGRDHGRDCT